MSDSSSSDCPECFTHHHECSPDCRMFTFVIEWYRELFEKDGMEVSNEELARGFAHCFPDFRKKFDEGGLDPDFFLHILIVIQKYNGFDIADDHEELPELNQPIVKGGAPLQNKHIRAILSKIGFPEATCSSKDLTNNEAGSMLLQNMDRINILAYEGKIDLSELRRVHCFATQNIEQILAKKKKKKTNKKKAK